MYNRIIDLNIAAKRTVFLWGARQTGKSTLLKKLFPDARRYDLLLSDTYRRLLGNPALIRQAVPPYHRKAAGSDDTKISRSYELSR